MSEKCFRCGSEKNVILHHVSYIPEKMIFCCRSCHKKIHDKVRKNKACLYSPKEIQLLTRDARAARYKKRSRYTFSFHETLLENIRLWDVWQYNKITGNVNISSYFEIRGRIDNE